MKEIMDNLRTAGAQAVKPTGSGLGGFLLSLWNHPPPDHTQYQMIPLYAEQGQSNDK